MILCEISCGTIRGGGEVMNAFPKLVEIDLTGIGWKLSPFATDRELKKDRFFHRALPPQWEFPFPYDFLFPKPHRT